MQVYILMQSAGAPAGPFWAGRPKRRRAPPGSVPGGAQGKFRFRVGASVGVTEGRAPSLRGAGKSRQALTEEFLPHTTTMDWL